MNRIFFILLFFLALAAAAEAPQKTMLVLGDSIAAGYGVEPEQAYPALLQQKIDQARLNWKVVNAGVSGDTTAGGLRRINWLLRQKVDLLLLELGGNDGLRGISPEETARNLDGIIARVKEKYPSAEIVIAGMRMPENMGAEYTTRFRGIFKDAARKHGAALVPFLLEGVAGRTELNQPDRIHPAPEGHKIVAENIWKVLEPILKQRS
jgi:acyl-CoA thioesterase-1